MVVLAHGQGQGINQGQHDIIFDNTSHTGDGTAGRHIRMSSPMEEFYNGTRWSQTCDNGDRCQVEIN